MQKTFQTSLFLFRRDLRLEDNTGLIFALKNSRAVIPAFIFTSEQIEQNSFRSDHCLQFMIESLEDLQRELKEKGGTLYFFKGKPEEVTFQLFAECKIDAVIVNRDYTPYSKERDEKLEKLCKKKGIIFHSFDDALLHPPERMVKKDGKPYTVFTPYFRNAVKEEVPSPISNQESNYFQEKISFAEESLVLTEIQPRRKENLLKGGRKEALEILGKIKNFKEYDQFRDFPGRDYSTHLSPYLKFTVCSPREVHAIVSKILGPEHALIRSLYWRDFFTSIGFFFPHVFKGSFRSKFDELTWSSDKKLFKLWQEGYTGFPIVDAGMREMHATGFMHNRVRMIVASFLVKDLHIDWRWGEKYFAQTLIDYDPAVNNGNWQWVASTGCDAQPYFRIFNPWNQQKKWDPDCVYIKKWVPELRELPPQAVHGWYQEKYRLKYPIEYPKPILDHEEASKQALVVYRDLTGKNE